jgi:hypothetical protein
MCNRKLNFACHIPLPAENFFAGAGVVQLEKLTDYRLMIVGTWFDFRKRLLGFLIASRATQPHMQ